MRCEDVTRELAAPSGRIKPDALAGHLASCPACAGWSSRADRLDRVWAATRPADPSPDSLDALWARASAALDAPAPLRLVGPDAVRARSRARNRGRGWAIGVLALGMAQAAALMVITLNLIDRPDGPGPAIVAGPKASAVPSRVTAEVYQTLVVRFDEAGSPRVERLDETPVGYTLADATPHDVFSAVESAATQ